jgi:diguanylate cyclase (GGDEF)-like protein
LERANERLDRLARTDDLTGLANRRAFMERLREEVARARRMDAWLAVVMLDLDHFKQINDRHGHAMGDDVLRRVAAALLEVARESDVTARVGGEEVAILLPGSDLAGAQSAAERAAAAVAALSHDTFTAPFDAPITVSGGVAAARGRELDDQDLVACADRGLYAAKREGRNRILIG